MTWTSLSTERFFQLRTTGEAVKEAEENNYAADVSRSKPPLKGVL